MDTQKEMDALADYLKDRGFSDSDSVTFLACCVGRMVGHNARGMDDAKASTRTLCAALAGACAKRLQERGIPGSDADEPDQPPEGH